jgi:hypothetical protein
MYKKELDPNFAMEIEFKITSLIPQDYMPSPRLIIKQARPWIS